MLLHDLPANGQPQARPFGLGAYQRLEELIAELRGNPRSVVLHNDRIHAASARGPKADVAAVGRGLDGVGKEVPQHLAQLERVGGDQERLPIKLHLEGDAPAVLKRVENLAHRLAQVEFLLLRLFDPGHLHEIGGQPLGGVDLLANVVDVLAALGEIRGRAAFEKEGGVAHHEQRIAQVVDDAGRDLPDGRQPRLPDELVLGLGQLRLHLMAELALMLQKLLVGLAQHLLRLLALGDVPAYPYQPKNLSLIVFERHLRRQDGPGIAAGIQVRLVLVDHGLPRAQQLLLVGAILRGQLRRVKIGVGFAQQLARRCCAHDPRDGEIGGHEAALGVFDVDEIRQVVDQGAEEIAILLERLFHFFPLRNVRDRGLAEGLLLRTLDRNAMELHGDRLAALAHQVQLGSDLAALRGTLVDVVQESLLIALRHVVGKGMTRQRIALRQASRLRQR